MFTDFYILQTGLQCSYVRAYNADSMDGTSFHRESTERHLTIIVTVFRKYLTIEEELQICQQFHDTWRWDNRVMGSGMLREYAQEWAYKHDMTTLTTVMGTLMTLEHPLCLKRQKSDKGWSKYIKGASAVFAWHISRGERVTVLSPPPPERFHQTGHTNCQALKEPIIKGNGCRLRIELVHSMIEGAENFSCQMWPVDEINTWIERFGKMVKGT